MGKHNIWSGQEDNILKDNYGKLKYKDIQSLIFKHTKVRRSIGAIRTRVQILGIANKIERLVVDSMDNVINLGFDIIKEICKWHNVDIKVVTNVERYMEILQLVDNIGE